LKKVLLIAVLVLVFSTTLSTEAFAAPSIAVKSGAMAGLIGLEMGIATSQNFSIMLVGGFIGNGACISVGTRYYFLPEGWRPFLSGYLGMVIFGDPYYGVLAGLVTTFTGGVEHVSDSGFLFTAELGIGMSGGYFAPALGISLGRKF